MFLYQLFCSVSEKAEDAGVWDYDDKEAQYNVIARVVEFAERDSAWDLRILYEYYFRATLCAILKRDKERAEKYSSRTVMAAGQLDQSTRLAFVRVLLVRGFYVDADAMACSTQDRGEFRAQMKVMRLIRNEVPFLR